MASHDVASGICQALRHGMVRGAALGAASPRPHVQGRGLHSSTFRLNVGYVGCMISPLSIRQGDAGRCDQNGLGCAEKWTSASPWSKAIAAPAVAASADADAATAPADAATRIIERRREEGDG